MASRDSTETTIRHNDLLRVRGKRRTLSLRSKKFACKFFLPSAELPLPLFYSGVPRISQMGTWQNDKQSDKSISQQASRRELSALHSRPSQFVVLALTISNPAEGAVAISLGKWRIGSLVSARTQLLELSLLQAHGQTNQS